MDENRFEQWCMDYLRRHNPTGSNLRNNVTDGRQGLTMPGRHSERALVTVFDCQIVSEANRREHWGTRRRRTKAQRNLVAAELLLAFKRTKPPLPVTVTLTRIAPRRIDDDNLARAFKAIRDSVADYLLPANCGNQSQRWADDSDGRVTWQYAQRKGKPKQHAVEIRIEPR